MRIASAAVLSLLLLADVAHGATLAVVPITACGQQVPAKTRGLLMSDLDCTGFVGGIDNVAVSLGDKAVLDLQGFTLTGGSFGVGCFGVCADGGTSCNDAHKCEVVNGTVTGAEASGISGERVTVRNVTASNNGENGVQGYQQARVYASIITQNGQTGVRAHDVRVEGSIVTDNGESGVSGSRRNAHGFSMGVRVTDSTVTGNGTSPECANPNTCADITSGTRPKVRRTVCGTSAAAYGSSSQCGLDWCVCTDD